MADLTIKEFETLATQRVLLDAYYGHNGDTRKLTKRAACSVNDLLVDYGLSGSVHTIARGEKMYLVCNANQRIICEMVLDDKYGVICMTRKGYERAKTVMGAAGLTAKLKLYRKEK